MIRKKDLGAMKFIAKGAVGRVYALSTFRMPGCPPLAYKEVKQVAPGELTQKDRDQALAAMTKSVAFRAGLTPADRDDLDRYTTWPIDMVEEHGEPCGLVMPLIPPEFFVKTRPLSGPSQSLVFDLSWLSAKEATAQAEGIDRSGVRDLLVRIALLAQLVYAVGRLHKHGAVYGDLSLKNAALAVNPPRVKLLDCDAAAALSDPTRVQLHSPFFKPPEMVSRGQKLQDELTDVYKLGLCIIRGLQQGPGVTQTKLVDGLVGKLDAHAVDTVRRAVSSDRSLRPSAKDLFDCLERNLLAKASPPVLHSARLNRSVLLRGQDVEVTWEATGGRNVRILGPNGLEVAMPDPGVTPASLVVTPPASGAISVEVSNAHGCVVAVAGHTELYELPPFHVDVAGIARPVIPSLETVTIPAVLHSPPPAPMVSTAGHPAPRVAVPPLDALTDAIGVMRAAAAPFHRLSTALAEADIARLAGRQTFEGAPAYPDIGASAASAAASLGAAFAEAEQRLRTRAIQELQATATVGTKTP
jgi:hypothetical protein